MTVDTDAGQQRGAGRAALLLCRVLVPLTIILGVTITYRYLDGYYPMWLALLVATGLVACVVLSAALLASSRCLPRSRRRSRRAWAGSACVLLAVLLFLSPFRPFSPTEQRVCADVVSMAIVAEQSSDVRRSGLPATRDLSLVLHGVSDREDQVRYSIRQRIVAAAQAAGGDGQHSSTESAGRLAEASRQLQLACGYREPPIGRLDPASLSGSRGQPRADPSAGA